MRISSNVCTLKVWTAPSREALELLEEQQRASIASWVLSKFPKCIDVKAVVIVIYFQEQFFKKNSFVKLV